MDVRQASIRLAHCAEADTIAELSRDSIEVELPWRWRAPEIARFIKSDRHNVIVAEREGSFGGFAVMGYQESDAYLALLAVLPAARRAGLARRMLDWLLKTADIAGIARVSVDMREDNLAARTLYEQAGFTLEKRTALGYYGRVDQISLRLTLRVTDQTQ